MRRKLSILALLVIFLLCLQYGNQSLNVNHGAKFFIQDSWNNQTENPSQSPEWNYQLNVPTLAEGKIGIGPQAKSTTEGWTPSVAGYQGSVISSTGKVAYVWMSDYSNALLYEQLLDSNGIPTDLISVSDLVLEFLMTMTSLFSAMILERIKCLELILNKLISSKTHNYPFWVLVKADMLILVK
jgi:hypothetical protein